MKNIILKLIVISILILGNNNLNAQFVPSSLTDTSNGLPNVWPYNTGNDVLDDGTNSYSVSVWSELSNPGISWKVITPGGDYSGYLILSPLTDINHADVCLVRNLNNGDVSAIVGWYYAAGGFFGIDEYLWDVSTSTFAYNNLATAAGNWGTTLNVDGDDNGNFIMVYDDNNNIFALSGTVTGGFSMNSGTTPFYLQVDGVYPDVSINSCSGNEVVYLTFIEPVSSTLNVVYDLYSEVQSCNLITGFQPSILPVSPAISFSNSWPRIACPGPAGIPTDWTVVWQEDDRYKYYIKGINDDSNTPSAVKIYNDGTFISGIDLTDVPNQFPVVTYDDQSTPNIWIGWNMDNTSTYYDDPPSGYTNIVNGSFYPIALKCDYLADPISTDYLQVPYYISTDNHAFPLSLSGRYALNTIYITTWYDDNYDIYTKMVSSSASNLKIASTNLIDHQTMENDKLFLNQKTDAIVSFKLFDITGKLLVNESGSIHKIKNMLSVENIKIPHGVYLIKLLTSDGKNYLSQKIVF